jgi:hypothetical protein
VATPRRRALPRRKGMRWCVAGGARRQQPAAGLAGKPLRNGNPQKPVATERVYPLDRPWSSKPWPRGAGERKEGRNALNEVKFKWERVSCTEGSWKHNQKDNCKRVKNTQITQ